MGYFYIFLTIAFTVYGQLILKWQVSQAGAMPAELAGKVTFLAQMFLSPWVMSSLVSAFLAALTWMAALTKFPLSFAYPFMSLAFPTVIFFSGVLFMEQITLSKWVGLGIVMAGLVVCAQKW